MFQNATTFSERLPAEPPGNPRFVIESAQ